MTAPQNTAPKTMAELAAEYGLAPNEYQSSSTGWRESPTTSSWASSR